MPPEPTDKPLPQLAPATLQLFEQSSLRYDAVIPMGLTPQALLEPSFWAHHAGKLQPWNEVRARAEDGTWVADCLVLDCSRNWAKVTILRHYPLTTAEVSITQASEQEMKEFIGKHNLVFRGTMKWSATRKSDKAVVTEGHETKEAAKAALEAIGRAQIQPAAAAPKPAPVAS